MGDSLRVGRNYSLFFYFFFFFVKIKKLLGNLMTS